MLPRLAFRRTALLVALAGAAAVPLAPAVAAKSREAEASGRADEGSFRRFVEGELRRKALAAGVSAEVFADAMRGITLDPKVVALTRKQSEFVRPISDYVAGAAAPSRVAKGREMAERWSEVLDRVERRYGVPRAVVLAFWGMESGYGANTGGLSVIRSLATLAALRYRGDFFSDELVEALKILQAGHVTRAEMKGSWAGAMGQTQFMPSSFRDYAVDFDGDGRRDIWTSVPDALASTANYLKEKGWRSDLPWGFEVALPGSLDLRTQARPFGEWASLGVERIDGQAMPRSGAARLFLPMGVRGPTFLLTDNFEVIRAYNSSDAYSLGVGYLANRLAGANTLARPWPAASETLDTDARKEVQSRLASLGLYKGEADGRHGAVTRDAIRQFQVRNGLVADGYADAAVLKALRAER